MRLALIGDTHMNLFRRHNSFFTHVERTFDYFIEQCNQRKIENIIVCGDLFHTKSFTATDALLKANDIIKRLSDIANIYMIPGNHDMVKNDDIDINLLNNYKHYSNIKIFNEYGCEDFDGVRFDFLPYRPDDILKKAIAQIKTDGGPCVLISHFGAKGFSVNEGEHYSRVDSESEIDEVSLKKFKRVFLGHYHGHQEKGNIMYVSAPLQSRFGDQFSRHGFVFYNTIKDEAEFVDNICTPQFVSLEFAKENIQKAFELRNHYIRFEVNKHVSKELLMAVKLKLIKSNYEVEYKFNIAQNSIQFATIEGWDKIVYNNTDDLLTSFVQNLISQNAISKDFKEQDLLDILLK